MTKKDLFRVIIKLFGLYVAFAVFSILPEVLFSFFSGYDSFYTAVTIATILILSGVLLVLIFKTDLIVDLFRLEKGFDDEGIEMNQLRPETILQIGLVIISLYFIVASIPDVITNIFYVFKSSIPRNTLDEVLDVISTTNPNYYVLTSASIKLVLGFLMLTNKNRIAKRIERLNNK